MKRVEAIQNQQKLNNYFDNTATNGGEVTEYVTDYLKTCHLMKAFEQAEPQFSWSRRDFENGYGFNMWSCAAVQSEIGSPTSRMTSGDVTFQYEFTNHTQGEITATVIYINPSFITIKTKISIKNGKGSTPKD